MLPNAENQPVRNVDGSGSIIERFSAYLKSKFSLSRGNRGEVYKQSSKEPIDPDPLTEPETMIDSRRKNNIMVDSIKVNEIANNPVIATVYDAFTRNDEVRSEVTRLIKAHSYSLAEQQFSLYMNTTLGTVDKPLSEPEKNQIKSLFDSYKQMTLDLQQELRAA